MNGWKLFEGMSHIDARFVDEAEHGRMPRTAWRGWAAAAACLCLLTCVTHLQWSDPSIPETDGTPELGIDATSAGIETEDEQVETTDAVLRRAWYVRSGWVGGEGYPHTVLISSREALMGYIAEVQPGRGFEEICERYDDHYFDRRDLLLLVVEEGSGSIRHEVLAVRPEDGGWVIDLRTMVPEVGTTDMAQWHILLEVQKDRIGEADPVAVNPVK